MTINIKLIMAAVIVVIAIIAGLSIYIYIDNLKDTISDLNATVADKDNVISQLSENIEILQKEIESIDKSSLIVDEYIYNIQEIKTEEDIIKDAIYNEVINNETDETKAWFNERLPDNLINILNDGNKRMCENSI